METWQVVGHKMRVRRSRQLCKLFGITQQKFVQYAGVRHLFALTINLSRSHNQTLMINVIYILFQLALIAIIEL